MSTKHVSRNITYKGYQIISIAVHLLIDPHKEHEYVLYIRTPFDEDFDFTNPNNKHPTFKHVKIIVERYERTGSWSC